MCSVQDFPRGLSPMIQIAHLSDLHFGTKFSIDTWTAVADSVIVFEPDLIIVSGDLVDHPSPVHLLAAKSALRDLSQKSRERSKARSPVNPRAAELVVIAGNHDVYESGLSTGVFKRLNWFERIFRGDTSEAEATLAAELGHKVGFNRNCRDQPAVMEGRFPWLREVVSGQPRKEFTSAIPETCAQEAGVFKPQQCAVLLALLDSNPPGGKPDFATGVVDEGQLIGLTEDLRKLARTSYLARIAVVHHHVLPIAFAPGREGNTEPMMVLRNAGAVLNVLADHRFDLILHGHWHQAQFARVDLGTDDNDSYSMAVVAAGSAAMETSNPIGNSFNLITIEDNGRVSPQLS